MGDFYKVENTTNKITSFHDVNGRLRTIAPNGNNINVPLDDRLVATIHQNTRLVCTKIPPLRPGAVLIRNPQRQPNKLMGRPVLPPIRANEQPGSVVVPLNKPKVRSEPSPALNPGSQFPNDIILVVGGAECWQDDLNRAKAFCDRLGRSYCYFIVNDHIGSFTGQPVIGCSLHPGHKLGGWLKQRKTAGLPDLTEVWAHRATANQTTHNVNDWGGSVGLFSARVAIYKGCKKIILCGVPMSPDYGHFVRKIPWRGAKNFHHGWKNHLSEIKPFVRSMTGWTRNLLGEPTEEWLKS